MSQPILTRTESRPVAGFQRAFWKNLSVLGMAHVRGYNKLGRTAIRARLPYFFGGNAAPSRTRSPLIGLIRGAL